MAQLLKVRVSTHDTELEYTVKNKTSGQSLFDQVVQTIGVREVWFFGLEHKTQQGNKTRWLDLSKRISKQDIKREAVLKFEFKVKYFPEDVQEIIQEKTLKLFYQQVKADILSSALFATADKCVLLSSYAAQVRHGDLDGKQADEGYLANDKILPAEVISKHKLSREEWEERVTTFHKNHAGLTKGEAMLEYLKLVQDLEMYGISYFRVVNKRGTEVLMGIDSRGINVYNKNDKLNPTISFPWSEVAKVKPTKTSLKIKLVAKQSPPFSVKADEPLLMTDLAVGNHNLFVRRRDPKETLEIQQMKREREEKRLFEKTQNEKLKKEIAEKNASQAACKEYEEKFLAMQMSLDEYREQLTAAQKRIQELEEQLKETNEAKEALADQQDELKALLETLEKDKELGVVQKEELLEEITRKQTEIEESKALIASKELEAQKLRLEMEAAQEEIKEANEKIHKVLTVPPPAPFATEVIQENGIADDDTKEAIAAVEAAVSGVIDSRRESLVSNAVDVVPAIVVSPEQLETLEVRDREALQDLTKELREELETARDDSIPVDTLERIAEENMAKGRSKFKTLREIRSGYAKRRIDTFENM